MNEAQWQNRMTMLVNSCDAYEDLWQPFFTLLKRYFAPLDMRILLNTESKDFRFEGLNIECVHSSAATYGERMTDALRRVKTEYTLLMLDDFFLREPVKMDRLHDLVRWMDADRDIVYFSSDITEALYDWEVDRYPGYRRLPVGNRYTLNMQAAVWRTDKFAEYWNHKVSPWDWEERCNVLTAAHPKDKFYCVLNEEARFLNYGYHKGQWMGICHGKWVEHDVVPFFAKEGIEIDYAKRGFVDLAHRPASLQKKPPAASGTTLCAAAWGRGICCRIFSSAAGATCTAKRTIAPWMRITSTICNARLICRARPVKSACLARCSDKKYRTAFCCAVFFVRITGNRSAMSADR